MTVGIIFNDQVLQPRRRHHHIRQIDGFYNFAGNHVDGHHLWRAALDGLHQIIHDARIQRP